MAAPSYEQLKADKAALTEEVTRLNGIISELKETPPVSVDAEIAAKLGEALERVRVLEAEKENTGDASDSDKARRFDEMRERAKTTDFTNPEERNRFLSEFEIETPNTEPEQDPAMGDLTPAYARWRVATATLEECRTIYAGREEHLPEDVRKKLK